MFIVHDPPESCDLSDPLQRSKWIEIEDFIQLYVIKARDKRIRCGMAILIAARWADDIGAIYQSDS